MKRFRLKLLNNRGDTIVEVLIVLAILSAAFGTSTGIATRSLHQSRTAEEHSQALGILNTQLEQLRSAATGGADVFQDGKPFCMNTANAPDYGFAPSYVIPASQNSDDFTKYAPACKDLSTFYNQSIVYDAPTGNYTIRVRWEGVGTLGRQQEITNYRTYKLTTTVAPSVATVFQCSDGGFDNDGDGKADAADPGCHSDAIATNAASYNPSDNNEINPACIDGIENDIPSDGKIDAADPGCHSDANASNSGSYTPTKTNETNAVCSDGRDNDVDGRVDLVDPGCSGNPAGITEVGPPSPAGILPDRFDAPAWHLFNTGGSRQNQTFTITNPGTSDSSLRIASITITGPNVNSFQNTFSGSCYAGRVLARGASCTVNVQFFPPSGGSNNHLGNAGFKTATLTINNSNGVAATPAALTGWAVSDRMAPGDVMVSTSDNNANAARGLRGYSPSCYNNAFTCTGALVLWADGNLVLYSNANTNSVQWASGTSGSGAYVAAMQGDDNFVLYSASGPVWDSASLGGPYSTGSGIWLMLYDGGPLRLMNPAWDNGSNSAAWSAPGW